MAQVQPVETRNRSLNPLVPAALLGAFVAVLLGVYGRVHDPASETTVRWFFTTTLHFKAWMTTVALALGLAQVFGALWMYGKLPLGDAPAWIGPAHRISGSLALLATLPVAYHCLWSLGFDPDPGGGRRLVHSVVGCLFYGAFATKVLAVRSKRLPSRALPLAGGLLFAVLVLIWVTSSWWFFRNIGVEV